LAEVIGHFLWVEGCENKVLPDGVENFPEVGEIADGVWFAEEVFKK
jgi:hypothetical protein